MLKQILADTLGLKMADIRLTAADTAMTPQADLGTWGSRVTLMAGNAVLDAAQKIKAKLDREVSIPKTLLVAEANRVITRPYPQPSSSTLSSRRILSSTKSISASRYCRIRGVAISYTLRNLSAASLFE